ncbi:hypothetical protein H8959_001862 [Pygathrix nigripes]
MLLQSPLAQQRHRRLPCLFTQPLIPPPLSDGVCGEEAVTLARVGRGDRPTQRAEFRPAPLRRLPLANRGAALSWERGGCGERRTETGDVFKPGPGGITGGCSGDEDNDSDGHAEALVPGVKPPALALPRVRAEQGRGRALPAPPGPDASPAQPGPGRSSPDSDRPLVPPGAGLPGPRLLPLPPPLPASGAAAQVGAANWAGAPRGAGRGPGGGPRAGLGAGAPHRGCRGWAAAASRNMAGPEERVRASVSVRGREDAAGVRRSDPRGRGRARPAARSRRQPPGVRRRRGFCWGRSGRERWRYPGPGRRG